MSGKFCELGALSNLKLIGLFLKIKIPLPRLHYLSYHIYFYLKKIF